MKSVENLPVGTRVRVVVEGTVEDFTPKPLGYGYPSRRTRRMVKVGEVTYTGEKRAVYLPQGVLAFAESVEQIAPSWQPGDVVSIAFGGGTLAPRYTYVRGENRWVGDRTNGLSDRDVDARFAEGKVRHLVRDGVPVVASTVAPF